MKTIFFDLDDTLYDAGQYRLGVFKEIWEYLSKKYKISQKLIYRKTRQLWKERTSMYPYLFNDLLKNLNIKENPREIVRIFNNYDGKMKPYSDTTIVLKQLKKQNYKLGIITDGNIPKQKRKIKNLGLEKFFEVIIFTKKSKPKPSKIPFLAALKKMKIKAKNAFYAADNPLIDFEGAKKAGMKTMRLKRGEFVKVPKNKYIDFEIKELRGLLKITK